VKVHALEQLLGALQGGVQYPGLTLGSNQWQQVIEMRVRKAAIPLSAASNS
jgi:hypothetical protein